MPWIRSVCAPVVKTLTMFSIIPFGDTLQPHRRSGYEFFY